MCNLVFVGAEHGPNWEWSTPPWELVKPLGDYLSLLLDMPDEDTVHGSQECLFRFPHIHRRVETLDVLSPIGERRHLSIDIEGQFLYGKVREEIQGRQYSQDWLKEARQRLGQANVNPDSADHDAVFGMQVPIPFGIFRKGILHEFSAVNASKEPLSLVGKNLCYLAGLAWCVKALGKEALENLDKDGALQPFLNYIWRIIQYVPKGRELEHVAEMAGTQEDPPPQWMPACVAQGGEFSDVQLADIGDRLYEYCGYKDGKPTLFRNRLLLLTINYFPLILIPLPKSREMQDWIPHPVIKVEWVYGRPAEDWVHDHDPKTVFADTYRASAAGARLPRRILGRIAAWGRGVVLPVGPWPYDTAAFGDIEGHCEHLNIKMPRGVEIVGNTYLPECDWMEDSLLVDQVASDGHGVSLPKQMRDQVKQQTMFKLQRGSVSIRRHKPIPGGRLKFRVSLMPSMEGIFIPGAASMAAVLLMLILMLIYLLVRKHELPASSVVGAGSLLEYLPLVAPLIAGAGSFIISQEREQLRAMLLRRVMFRIYSSLMLGSGVLVVYSFLFATHLVAQIGWPGAWHRGAVWLDVLLVVATVWVAYCTYFVIHTRLMLHYARGRLNTHIGMTRHFRISHARPDIDVADAVHVVGPEDGAKTGNIITVTWPGEQDRFLSSEEAVAEAAKGIRHATEQLRQTRDVVDEWLRRRRQCSDAAMWHTADDGAFKAGEKWIAAGVQVSAWRQRWRAAKKRQKDPVSVEGWVFVDVQGQFRLPTPTGMCAGVITVREWKPVRQARAWPRFWVTKPTPEGEPTLAKLVARSRFWLGAQAAPQAKDVDDGADKVAAVVPVVVAPE